MTPEPIVLLFLFIVYLALPRGLRAMEGEVMSTTNKVTHTPGPWDFEEGDRNRRGMSSIRKASDREFLIAHVLCDFRNDAVRQEDIANARLIAAAPELLAACKAIAAATTMCNWATMGEVQAARDLTVKAIAKAEGQG